MSDFKSFDKILHIGKLYMTITQKIHGSNAQILIEEVDAAHYGVNFNIKAGCRTRWLSLDDDNYGFCSWVMANKDELIAKLGLGRHYGEWAGPGINSGEGLKEKILCLFNHRRFIDKELPDRVTTVPVLYKGKISFDAINEAMDKLKREGSLLVPGYMHPEGIVIDLNGQLYKNVFDAEETRWTKGKAIRGEQMPSLDISHLLQPLRLQKLLTKDEKYIRDYPQSLGTICSDYIKDLEIEGQLSTDADQLKVEKKELGKNIYYFIKSIINALK